MTQAVPRGAVSNPLGQAQARAAGMTHEQWVKWRIQRARSLWSLATMLVGASLVVVGSALAWGWPGGLIAAGAMTFTLGVVLGLTSAVPE